MTWALMLPQVNYTFSKKEDEKCFIHLIQLAIRLFFSEVPTNMCKHVKHAYDLFGE